MPRGEDIQFPSNGGTANGYLATPDSGSGPGIVVIQEWWGLNHQIRTTADRFASEGFVALAPDFYHGKGAEIGEPDEAGKLMMALNIDGVARDGRGAVEWLRQRVGSPVGVIGFCMGGQLALLVGTVGSDDVGAVVDMYGVHPNVKPDFSRMKAPVMALFADNDGFVDASARENLARQMREAGVRYTSDVYPGVDHAFMNDENPSAYNRDASEDAWRRITAFFRQELRT
ncbi:MAG: dienelactone hydrolase family protein [Chloroflexi bacterium]|nr:dienelactone hydrolase family protein [Chloroflexota bacterium]